MGPAGQQVSGPIPHMEAIFHAVDCHPGIAGGDLNGNGGQAGELGLGDVSAFCPIFVVSSGDISDRIFRQGCHGLRHLAVKLPLDGDGAAGDAAGEGAPRGDSDQRQHGDSDTGLPAGALGDAGDPLPEGRGLPAMVVAAVKRWEGFPQVRRSRVRA